MSKLKSRRAARSAAGNSLYTDRKAIILKAAADVFLRKGFIATKLSDIAEEASMDRASLYYYVSSKQDLFEEIFTTSVLYNIETAHAVEQENISNIEKLTKLMEMLMASFEEKYPFFYIFVQEDLKKIELLDDPKNKKWLNTSKKLSKEYFAIIKRLLAEAITNGEIETTMPPSLIAHSLIGMMNSSSNWFTPNGPMTGKAIGAAMAHMVFKGLAKR